jgi:hypothetical protein
MDAISGYQLVGIDTEWTNGGAVATFQFAVWNKQDGVEAWVVDLMKDDSQFQERCKRLVASMFESQIILGFAVGHDIPKLEAYVGHPLKRSGILDAQRLWTKKQPLGLAACAKLYSSKALSKTHQCSNWDVRPLSSAQIEYAGLDAAILLALVAEKACGDEN